MGIDARVFAEEMTILADRFNRDVSKPVRMRYFESLDRRMSTEEFALAARRIFESDTFWPSPDRFLEITRGTAEDRAELEWARVLEAAKHGQLPTLDAAGMGALRGIGGFNAVQYADQAYALPKLKRDFLAAYERRSATAETRQVALALGLGGPDALGE